jgi:hypothetical protein
MRALGTHEKAVADEADEADRTGDGAEAGPGTTALWWESDPQLRDRFG